MILDRVVDVALFAQNLKTLRRGSTSHHETPKRMLPFEKLNLTISKLLFGSRLLLFGFIFNFDAVISEHRLKQIVIFTIDSHDLLNIRIRVEVGGFDLVEDVVEYVDVVK